ncbi:MAG: methyltransferase domain-containing protein [Phycisphaerae bacterium]|nr:methyltransferase domain-containing protein [Phycisphaerae bacterium]
MKISSADETTPLNQVPVYSYWEGPKPDWIKLCLESLRRNVPNVRIMTFDEFMEIADSEFVPRNLKDQRPNVKSDFIRAYLLHYHGGIWVDADCIALRDIRHPWVNLKRHDFFAYKAGRPAPQVCSAFIGSYKGGAVAREYLAELTKRLHGLTKNQKAPVLHLGPRTLHIASAKAGQRIFMVPTRWIHQIHWLNKHRLWQEDRDDDHALAWETLCRPGDPYCFMLTHKALGPLRSHTRNQLLNGKSFVSWMFRKSLSEEAAAPAPTRMVHRPQVEEAVERIQFVVDYCRGKKVLDIGFTAAGDREDHRRKGVLLHDKLCEVASHYTGFDTPNAVKGFEPHLKAQVIWAGWIDNPETSLADEYADVVVAGEVLEHLINPGIALKLIQRAIAKDGRLLITVPNCLHPWLGARAAQGIEQVSDDHTAWYSPATIRKLLEKTDFEVERMIGYAPKRAPRVRLQAKGSFLRSHGLIVIAKPKWV